MPITENEFVKFSKKAADLSVRLMEREMVTSKAFTRIGFDDFKGSVNDTANIVVPGILPAHEYAFRNNRAAELEIDTYRETKIPVTLGTHVYSRVQLTDEQFEFDLTSPGWQSLLQTQMTGIANYLDAKCAAQLSAGEYAVTLGIKNPNDILRSIAMARHVLNKTRAPMKNRILLVGTDFDAALQMDETFNRSTGIGENGASNAIREATIGRIKGFDVVVSQDIKPGEAYALSDGAFVMAQAAPRRPDDVGAAGTAALDGFALRWMRQYNPSRLYDESVVDAWAGWTQVKDPVYFEKNGQWIQSTDKYAIRAVKLTMGDTAADSFFATGTDKDAVATGLGLKARPKSLVEKGVTA